MEVIALTSISNVVAMATLSETSTHFMSTMERVGKQELPRVSHHLQKLDIAAQLEAIQALIQQVERLDSAQKKGTAVQVTLKNVIKAVEKINQILQELEAAIDNHSSKWFSSIRVSDYNVYLTQLDTNKAILDRRMDLLAKALSLPPAKKRWWSRN